MHVPTPSHDAEPEASGDPSVGRARTCVGCGEPEPLSSARAAGGKLAKLALRPLVRLLLGPGGEIAVDTGARGKTAGFGRGAYVHAEPRCIAAAAQRGLLRAAKGPALMGGERVTAQGLTRAITEAYERRSLSLLSTAKRAGKLDVGSSRVVESTRRGHAHLVIVATDAAAAADMFEVRDAVSAGRALAWGSKQELAARLGGAAYSEGVGVVAVTDTRIAGALLESRRIVDALASGPAARALSRRLAAHARTPLTVVRSKVVRVVVRVRERRALRMHRFWSGGLLTSAGPLVRAPWSRTLALVVVPDVVESKAHE